MIRVTIAVTLYFQMAALRQGAVPFLRDRFSSLIARIALAKSRSERAASCFCNAAF